MDKERVELYIELREEMEIAVDKLLSDYCDWLIKHDFRDPHVVNRYMRYYDFSSIDSGVITYKDDDGSIEVILPVSYLYNPNWGEEEADRIRQNRIDKEAAEAARKAAEASAQEKWEREQLQRLKAKYEGGST